MIEKGFSYLSDNQPLKSGKETIRMTKKSPARKFNTSSRHTPSDTQTIVIVFAIVLVTAVAFFPSLHNGFTNWDDNQYVTQNELIKDLSWNGVKTFFTTFYGGNYHPLVALTNAIEYHFWQLNPTPYHVFNLLFHLANTTLVFFFIFQLTARIEAASIVALFFGIHPMHVESVAWIAERKDVLYTCFYLASMILYVRYLKSGLKPKYLVLSWLLLLVSLFSKSAAVIAPVTMILIDFYLKREWSVRLIVEKIPFAAVALTFGIVALFSQGSAKALNTLASFSLLDRFFISIYAIVFYIGKLFAPFNLSAFYNFPLLGGPLPTKYYLAPVILAAIGFVIYKSKEFKRDLLFGLGFYLINVILVVQIISVGMTVVSERYAYVSYIGLLFIIARYYCDITDGKWNVGSWVKPAIQLALVGCAILCAVLTWERSKVWKDGITLFSDALQKEKTSPIPYYNRAMAKYHTNDFAGAIQDFDSAIRIYNKDVDYFLNRGASKFALNDFTGGLADFKEILKLNPNHADAMINCANAEAMLNNFPAALDYFNKAIALKPNEKLAYFNRGHLYFRMNQLDSACEDWRHALDMGYSDASFMLNKHCPQ